MLIKKNHSSNNIPPLRFPGFEGEWERKKLGEVGEIVTGLTYSPDQIDSNGVLVLRSSNIKEGVIALEDNVYVKTNLFNPVKENDILICVRNGSKALIGKNALIKKSHEGLAFGAFMVVFRSEINQFIFHHFSTKKYYKIISENLGATINSINNSDLKKFQFGFPSLPEQQKIASFFTAIDKKIAQLKQQKEKLELYKKGVMQQLFSQQLRFKTDDGKDFPDWEVKRLGEVTYKVDKKNKSKELLPVYSISNVNGFVPQSEQFDGVDSNDRGYDISLYKIVDSKTFAYNPARINVGSIGYNENLGRVIVSSLYVTFKTDDSVCDSFFQQFLKTPYFNNAVLKMGEGGVRIYLFYENFSEIKINLPSLEEQTKIAQFLSALDEKINKVQQQLQQTAQWKKGLLQKMFV